MKADTVRFVPFEMFQFDKPRKLTLSYSVIRKTEELTGFTLGQLIFKGMTTEDITKILWASFSEDDDDITLEDVQAQFHGGHFMEFNDLFDKLLDRSCIKPDKTPAKNVKSPSAG